MIDLRLVAICVFVALALAGMYGAFERGRSVERAATLQRAVELVQERDKLNVEVRNATPADICRRLGGKWVPEDLECQ